MTRPDYENMIFKPGETARWERTYKIGHQVAKWRRPLTGEVSLDATAKEAGVNLRVEAHHCQGTLYESVLPGNISPWSLISYGPRNTFTTIRINEDLSEPIRALILGHELGHLHMLDLGFTRPRNDEEFMFQERLAEYFGRRFILAGGIELPYCPPMDGSEITGQLVLFSQLETSKNWGEL